MNEYIDICINEANKALTNDEVPIGCCIVRNNEVLCSSHNTKNETNDSTNHAEILCIKEASSIINNWRLIDCDMYVTLYPCPMCLSAIRQARIKYLFYLCDNSNPEYQIIGEKIATMEDINPKLNIIKINDDKYDKILKKFYSNKR